MPVFSSGYPEKTSNSDEDRFLISDSTDSNKIKGTKWSTIKSSIQSYVEGFTDWITTSMLKNDSVNTSKILNGAVTNAKLANDAVTSEKLNPSISTETVGSITYRVYDYGSHKVYKGEFSQTNISAGTESATQAYPSGVQPTTGSQNCIADFSVFSTAGGYPNLYGFAFTCQNTGWKFYSSLAVSTSFRVVVTFTTYA